MISAKGMTEYTCPICKGVWLSDTITLTKKEIVQAQEEFIKWQDSRIRGCFLDYDSRCQDEDGFPRLTPACLLCLKLTQFATVHDPSRRDPVGETGKEGEDGED